MSTARHLTEDQERRLGEVWLEAGLGEHASVAAFGRFVLHLMSLGAPPSLLRLAAKAIDDEIEHARLCFGMARHFTGRVAGPGPLDLSGAIRTDDAPSAIVAAAVAEGCVHETISARQAEFALSRARDPVVRRVLERIAVDESAHADLSWSFVEWALAMFPDVKGAAADSFNAMLSSGHLFNDEEHGQDFPEQEEYGHLFPKSKTRITREIVRLEIVPRMESLIGA